MKHQTVTPFDTSIDLDSEVRSEIVPMLNQQLADNFDLFAQAKQAHWNVKGVHFHALHLLFDDVAASVLGYVDELAERVTALGGVAMGTVRAAAGTSTLPEFPTDPPDGEAYLTALRDRVAAYAASTRDASRRAAELGDPTTEDLFIEITRTVDKQLYFLEAHLQAK